MRYKSLTFKGNTYTQQYKIDEILIDQKFDWVLDAEIENAELEIIKDTFVWNNGLWINGIWKYGVFRNGEWRSGKWEGGVWYNGTWKNGVFKSGLIFDGKFLNGVILGQEIRGGDFFNIDISVNVIRTDQGKKEETNIPVQGQTILERKVLRFKDFNI